MIEVLKQALEALDGASGSMRRMQQRQPHVNYSNEALYGKITAAQAELRKAIAEHEESQPAKQQQGDAA